MKAQFPPDTFATFEGQRVRLMELRTKSDEPLRLAPQPEDFVTVQLPESGYWITVPFAKLSDLSSRSVSTQQEPT